MQQGYSKLKSVINDMVWGTMMILFLSCFTNVFAQDVTITYDPGPSGTFAGETSGLGIDGQSFTATKTGVIKSISVFGWMASDDTIKIYNGDGTGGTLMHSQIFPLQNAGQQMDGNRFIEISVDISSAVNITSGNKYTFVFAPSMTISMAYTDNNGYTDGIFYRDGVAIGANYDIAFKVVQGDAPVPVELNSFTASNVNGKVILNWQTATEVNNYGFDIERQNSVSSSQKSEQKWEKIGFVEGAGNSNSPKEYSYTDESTVKGTVQYRLKQIDSDGQFKYSETVEVKVSALPSKFKLLQNYPNPFNPSTAIRYSVPTVDALSSAEVHVSLKVYDILGNEVATLVNKNQAAGNYEVKFNGSNLASGIYIYKLSAGNFTDSKKLILMK